MDIKIELPPDTMEISNARRIMACHLANRSPAMILNSYVQKKSITTSSPTSPSSAAAAAAKRSNCLHVNTSAPKLGSNGSSGGSRRVRSASTGRDKKSELQARYWALLFGNLQRAINEIYETVESFENLASCQETILVLENYIRDFKSLAEWFRVSWNFDAKTQQQRPLAWEVRKSNPLRIRTKSLSGSTTQLLSGKSSPCSGKSSPCPTIIENEKQPSQSITPLSDNQNGLTGKLDVVVDQLQMEQETNKLIINCDLEDEKSENCTQTENFLLTTTELLPTSIREPTTVDNCEKYCQTDLDDENLTLEQWRLKYESPISPSFKPPQEQSQDSITVLVSPLLLSPQPKSLPSSSVESAAPNPTTTISSPPPQKIQQDNLNKPAKSILSNPELPISNAKNSSTIRQKTFVVANTTTKKSMITKTSLTSGHSTNNINTTLVNGVQQQKNMTAPLTNTQTGVGKLTAAPTSLYKRENLASVVKRNDHHIVPLTATLPINTKPRNNAVPSHVANRLTARSKTMMEMSNKNNHYRDKAPPPPIRDSLRTPLSSTVRCGGGNSRTMATTVFLNVKQGVQQQQLNRKMLQIPPAPPQSPSNVTDTANSSFSVSASTTSCAHEVKVDSDGWSIVKVKRKPSLHWVNRFQQPSGYASLPSLVLQNSSDSSSSKNMNEKSEKSTSKISTKTTNTTMTTNSRTKTNKSDIKPKSTTEQSKLMSKSSVTTKENDKKYKDESKLLSHSSTVTTNNCTDSSVKLSTLKHLKSQSNPMLLHEMIIKRQKSDLTGLKLTTLHREYLRNVNKKSKNNTEPDSVVIGDDQTKTNNENPLIDNAKTKTDENQSKNCELMKPSTSNRNTVEISLNHQRNNYHNKYQPHGGIIDFSASSCDEVEEKDDIESDEDQRKLLEEQASLERQIRELESTEIDIDTETDETDCEAMLDLKEIEFGDDHSSHSSLSPCLTSTEDQENMSLEIRYQTLLCDMSMGERTKTLAMLQAFVTRHPGRAQELHHKLSSPSRQRSLHETVKKLQAKQARAQEKRESLQREKTQKLQILLARVEDVKEANQQLIEMRRLRMERRMQRATDNRNKYLKHKVRKAHDEEEKMKEIAFIKNLEAQNKRLDIIESWREQEGRLQDLEQERQKKVEEKAAKEAAVEKRRLELELERQRRLEKMNENRREREQRIGEMQEKKEKLRQQMARDKARDREERLLALQVQQQHSTEELQKKIFLKQQESARRHEENIEQIRQRALELSIPSRNVDENGQRIDSECTNGDLSSVVSDVSREYSTKSVKKRLKKINKKLQEKSIKYLSEMDELPNYLRRESEVPKLLGILKKGGGTNGVDRPLGQILRLMNKGEIADYQCFWLLDGLGVISKFIPNVELDDSMSTSNGGDGSRRTTVTAIQIYRIACTQCPQIARHAILGNSITIVFDTLVQSLQTPDQKTRHNPVEISTEIMLATISPFTVKTQLHEGVKERIPYLISYVVAIGLVDILSRRCSKVHESVENNQTVILSLLSSITVLGKFTDLCPRGVADITQFLRTIKSTDMFGMISLLYSSVSPIGETIPKRTISLSSSITTLIIQIAKLDLATFQDILQEDTLSFQLLDVIAILLQYVRPKNNECNELNYEINTLLVNIITIIGFFSINNKKNQNRLISENSQIILKHLSKLPKKYEMAIYPTLVTIISDNDAARTAVGVDFDIVSLDEYKRSKLAQQNKLLLNLHEK